MAYEVPPPKNLPEPGYYYHFKHDPDGPMNNYAYYIYGVGHHTENGCRAEDAFMQVYRPLYEGAYAYRNGGLFDLRPLHMFFKPAEWKGKEVSRFTRIVDANVMQSVVSEFLVSLGHRLTCASSAQEARLFLASKPVDLALIDCLMSGEQGNSLAELASKLGVLTILTSGDPQYIEMCSGHPFPFLAKPFRLTSLDELIARILHAPGVIDRDSP